jgi:phosphopentomutase
LTGVIQLMQQENFDGAARGFAPMQARGNDAAVIGHQEIAGVQVVANVTKGAMFNPPISTMENQQAAAVARFRRLLGNERFR